MARSSSTSLSSPRAWTSASSSGEPPRATPPSSPTAWASCDARLPRRAFRARARLARTREGVRRPVAGAEAVEAPLTGGFVFDGGKLAVATEEDLFGWRRHTRSAPRITRRRTDAIAQELEPGDFAVHRVHGVGRYAGIQRRAVAAAERDYMVLDYAEGDRLCVPTDQVGMVAKYVGGEAATTLAPGLERLGAGEVAG